MAQLSISSYPVSYTTSGSLKGTNYQNAVGKGADTAAASGNDYCSSRNSYAHIYYAFDFSEIPNGANIMSVACQVKGHAENTSQSTERARCQLYVGTSTAKGNYSDFTSTSAQTLTLTTGTWTYDEVQDMRLRFTVGYYGGLVNGATVTVTYEVANPRTVTTTLSGNGTIEPSGETTTYDGMKFELTITPTNKSDTVIATKDGVDITSQLVAHGSGGTSTFAPSDVTTSGIQSGESYAQYCIGYTAENPYSSSNNMYASQSSTGYAAYSFDFSSIPSNATIEEIEVRCHGHRENSNISSTYVSQCVLYRGSTAISDEVDFPSTSSSIITLTPTTIPTRAQLDDVVVRHYVGYYGGLVTGISFVVTYSTGSGIDHYTYTYTVTSDATIAVTIGSTGSQPKVFIKQNGSWVQCSKIYKKINGSWVEQSSSNWDTVLPEGSDYRIIEL